MLRLEILTCLLAWCRESDGVQVGLGRALRLSVAGAILAMIMVPVMIVATIRLSTIRLSTMIVPTMMVPTMMVSTIDLSVAPSFRTRAARITSIKLNKLRITDSILQGPHAGLETWSMAKITW